MLYLIRGLPGSGKSTLAKTLAHGLNAIKKWSCLHFETDMYFETGDGYHFDRRELSLAHAWCQKATRLHLERGKTVIVSNTFTQLWELQPYLDMAKELDLVVTVITCEGQYGSLHNVPEHAVDMMKRRWQAYPGQHPVFHI